MTCLRMKGLEPYKGECERVKNMAKDLHTNENKTNDKNISKAVNDVFSNNIDSAKTKKSDISKLNVVTKQSDENECEAEGTVK